MDDETVRPLLKRIKSWVENSVIRRIIYPPREYHRLP